MQENNPIKKIFTNDRLLLALFTGLCIFIYGNTLLNGYCVDDYLVIENNELTHQGIKAIPEILTSNFIHTERTQAGYRPVNLISFAIEYELWKEQPTLSHAVNVLLFLLTVILIYRLLKQLFGKRYPALAGVAALIFIIHPIHTEVVASLKHRESQWELLFAMASTLMFLRYYRTGEIPPFIAGGLMFLLSLMSKESATQFVAAIPLLILFRNQQVHVNRLLRICILVCMLAGLFWLYYLLYLPGVERSHWTFYEKPFNYEHNYWLQLATGIYGIGYYLRLLIFPHPLAFYYGYKAIPIVSFSNPFVWITLLFCAGLLYVSIKYFKFRHPLSLGILFFFITIAMFSNIIVTAPGVIGERFVYTASLGYCISAGWLLLWIFRKSNYNRHYRYAVLGLAGTAIIFYMLKTITRNTCWKDKKTLANHDVKINRDAVIIHAYCDILALEELLVTTNPEKKKSLISKRIFHNRELIRINTPPYPAAPPDYTPFINLGKLYQEIPGKIDSAHYFLRKYLKQKPDDPEGYYFRARTFELTGEFDSANYFYNQAILTDSVYAPAWAALANLHILFEDSTRLFNVLHRYKSINPNSHLTEMFYASWYLSTGDTARAIQYYDRCMEYLKGNRQLTRLIAEYLKDRNPGKAREYLKTGQMKPDQNAIDILKTYAY